MSVTRVIIKPTFLTLEAYSITLDDVAKQVGYFLFLNHPEETPKVTP